MANCFTPADSAKIWDGVTVWMNSRPPDSDQESEDTYRFYPVNAVGTQQVNRIVETTWSGQLWHFLWGNRYNGGWNPRANIIFPNITHSNGKNCRVEYTSYAKAEAATKVQVMYTCGYDEAEYRAEAAKAGFNPDAILDHATLASDPDGFFTKDSVALIGEPGMEEPEFRVIEDIIYLPTHRLTDAPGDAQGVLIDAEFQDGRTPAQLKAHILDLAQVCHGKGFKIMIWTNPLNAPTQAETGFDVSNANDIMHAVDLISIKLWSGNQEGDIRQSWDNQLDVLRGPDGDLPIDFDKLFIVFELANTTMADAQFVRHLMESYVPRVWFWRNEAVQGGVCDSDVNRKIGCVALGRLAARPAAMTAF